MAEVPFRCRCVPGTGVSGVRVSLVNIDPVYGSARIREAGAEGWTLLERVAKPVDITSSSPDLVVELLDQTRSCTLACIGWRDRKGNAVPCGEITETIIRQAGYGSPRTELPRRGRAGG